MEQIVEGHVPGMRSRSKWTACGLLFLVALAYGCGGVAPIDVQPVRVLSADGSPAWSPDGTRIAYVHVDASAGIWLVDTAGASTRKILDGPWSDPDWSPDGTRLAIAHAYGNGIYTVTPTGEGLQAITPSGVWPRWSPTGNELAFQHRDTSGATSIGIVSRDGSRLRFLTPTGIESLREPDWAPDGTHLVHIQSFPYWPDSSSRDDIVVVDTTGHSAQRLTMDFARNASPTWSPDGRWIAWSKAGTIWVMRPDGTDARALTYGDQPTWSPDSRRIAYSSLLGGTVALLFVIDPETMRIRQLTQ